MHKLLKSIDIPSCIPLCNALWCTDQNHIKTTEDLRINIVNICVSALCKKSRASYHYALRYVKKSKVKLL